MSQNQKLIMQMTCDAIFRMRNQHKTPLQHFENVLQCELNIWKDAH